MMDYLYISIALIASLALVVHGKRFLGDQTHPAAIFILAWMVCTLTLTASEINPVSPGVIALVWVSVCFAVVSVVRKSRASTAAGEPGASAEGPGDGDRPPGSQGG